MPIYYTAIKTKYIGPTNHRPSRVKVTRMDGGTGLTVNWDHGLNVEQNHKEAARQLASVLGWDGTWIMGGGDSSGYVFVRMVEDFTSFAIDKAE